MFTPEIVNHSPLEMNQLTPFCVMYGLFRNFCLEETDLLFKGNFEVILS